MFFLAASLAFLQTAPPEEAPEPPAVNRAGLPVQVLDRKGEIPKTLTAQDFSVTEDGVARPVAGVAPVSQPWRVVLYVDRILTGSRTMRSAAGVLAERARELAALGTVEVVVAEPEPRVLLSPTREARAIDEVLSRLWLSGEGRDDLSSLRRRFLEERAAAGEEGLSPEEIAEAVETEIRLVRRQQEGLAEWLSSRSGDGPQLLLLVTDGYERDPGLLLRRQGGGRRRPGAHRPGDRPDRRRPGLDRPAAAGRRRQPPGPADPARRPAQRAHRRHHHPGPKEEGR